MQWMLELGLVALLTATLFHAVRLERALGVLKRDRAALQELVQEFNSSTQQAEAGVERLRGAVDGAGRQIARQIEGALALKEDLLFLAERGERLADRLDNLVRAGRPMDVASPRGDIALTRLPAKTAVLAIDPDADQAKPPRVRSQAERDLLLALRSAR
ncbi:DUF6468 domain-containing protein [Phenylobacterium sp.]|uniref:DUF6468 domain-containing protein n=1 Tax=Phenylobacterium sp. TaxID=1871053 RepID=UPI00374DF34D